VRSWVLAALLLVSSASAADSGTAFAASGQLVTVMRSTASEPLGAFIEALGRSVGLDVVLLPGMPDAQVSYSYTKKPFSSVLHGITAGFNLASCVQDAVLYVGPQDAVQRVCAGVISDATSGDGSTLSDASFGSRFFPAGGGLAPVVLRTDAPLAGSTVAGPARSPARYAVRVRLLEISDNAAVGGGVDWSAGLLPAVVGAGLAALGGGGYVPASLTQSISALEQHGLARKLDDVRLQLTDGQATQFRSGGTLQLSLVSAGAEKIERSLPYGLTLGLTPVAAADGSVSLSVVADLSSPVSTSNTALLDLATRSVTGSVALRPGAGVVLASWSSVRDEGDSSGLPGVSSLPVVGYLAGRSSTTSARSTVVVTLDLEAV